MSHELRTPLALILGPIEKLLAGESDPSRIRDLELMRHNARTLLRHVNDLLDVSKLEAGKMSPSYVSADLSRLVRHTAAHFEALAAERLSAFTVEVPDSAPA